MEFILNFGFAGTLVILTIASCIVYILRKLIVQTKVKNKLFISLNKAFRKHHKLLGILLVGTQQLPQNRGHGKGGGNMEGERRPRY